MMTKLEEEIENALEDAQCGDYDDGDLAKAAAEVAKRYIEASFDAGAYAYGPTFMDCKIQWLKENGVL